MDRIMKRSFVSMVLGGLLLMPVEGISKCNKGYVCCSGLDPEHVREVTHGDENFTGTNACVRIWREGCWYAYNGTYKCKNDFLEAHTEAYCTETLKGTVEKRRACDDYKIVYQVNPNYDAYEALSELATFCKESCDS